MKVGDLVKFDCPFAALTRTINGKHALYLGEDFIRRDDGVLIENHKVLLLGQSVPMLIDQSLLRWVTVLHENR